MRKRWRRILVLAAVALVLVLALGLGLFTWLAFWPFEGSVERMAGLVPTDVDFVYRTTWQDLKGSGWVRENVREEPFLPQVEEVLADLEQGLERVATFEAQINGNIPLGLATFSVERDLFPGEVIAAGRFCEGSLPPDPPEWREILVLTRISFKTRFVSLLKHGFVRDRLGRAVAVEPRPAGHFKITLRDMSPGTARGRQCAPGLLRPPLNEFYLRRVKDVLAVSNSEALITGVGYLAEHPQAGSFADRPGISLEVPPRGIAASITMGRLEPYLVRLMERLEGTRLGILDRYVTVTALDRLNGHLVLASPLQANGHAKVLYYANQLRRGLAQVYALGPQPISEGIVQLLPQEDTFAVLLLRTPPLYLLQGIHEDILNEEQRNIWRRNLQEMGRYAHIDEFFAEFAGELESTAAVAVGRVSEVFDRAEYPTLYASDFELSPKADDEALALTMMVRLRRGVLPDELDAFLAERIPLLGASRELEKRTHNGMTYTRMHLMVRPGDFAQITPSYVLAQDHFIFCSNESYFRRILDTIRDPVGHPSLAADRTFRAAAEVLPPRAQVAFFLDLEKVFRVPAGTGPGAQPRGVLWDRRNTWVLDHRHPDVEAVRFREELLAAHIREHGRPPTDQELSEIYRRVHAYAEQLKREYPRHLEEYREILLGYRRLRSLGMAFSARRDPETDQEHLTIDASLLLTPADAGEGPR